MTVRPFRPSDQAAVNTLHHDVWWPERSDAGWRWLEANPARVDIDAPSGWVVEDAEGKAAAFIGNLVHRFWLNDAVHHAATGFSVIVPPTVRGKSRQLIRSVLQQPDIFAAYTLNANPKSAPLYARHGMKAWPGRTHALKLSWVIDPIDCLHGRVLREMVKRAPRLSDPYRERFLHRRLGSPRRAVLPSNVAPLDDFNDASPFADFWTALKAEGRLVADRSPAMLRWRMSDPDQTRAPVVLAYRRDGQITGYALAILAKATPIEPVFLEILDLVALQDEPHAIPALMRALVDQGRAMGAAKVRLQVVNEALLQRMGAWAVGARKEGGWGHSHILVRDGAPSVETWAPTPYEADYAVCQRPLPVRPATSARRQQPAA